MISAASSGGNLKMPVPTAGDFRVDVGNAAQDELRERLNKIVEGLYDRLHKIMHELPKWGKEQRERVRDLNREFTTYAVGHLIDELKERHRADEFPRHR